MSAIDRFRELAAQERFRGWPVVGEPQLGEKIPFFGQPVHYDLETGNGVERYSSILRHFGWAIVFGVTSNAEGPPQVITLCQWKPGVNCASWELPPGGIGKIGSEASEAEILSVTRGIYQSETGFGGGSWSSLGHIMIETGKYRGASFDDHGLRARLFLARGLREVSGARRPNGNEIMETIMVPLDEFREVLESGLFLEESAVVCAYRAMIQLGKLVWRAPDEPTGMMF